MATLKTLEKVGVVDRFISEAGYQSNGSSRCKLLGTSATEGHKHLLLLKRKIESIPLAVIF